MKTASTIAIAAAIWVAGAVLYGAVEVATNTAAGLYLPSGDIVAVFVVYAIAGLLGGVAMGVGTASWWRLRGGTGRPGAPAAAGFVAVLLLVYVGIRINDRVLGSLLSPRSLVVNVGLVAAAAGVGFGLFRHLRGMTGSRLALAFVLLVTAVGGFVAIALNVDTFVLPTLTAARGVLTFAGLAVGSAVLYGLVIWLVGALAGSGTGRRRLVVTGAGVALVIVAGASHLFSSVPPGEPAPAAATGKPNVVWLVLDTTRADHLSTYGYSRRTTPHIDAAAAEGAVFEHAIAGASWTIPSHFQMVTGRLGAGNHKVLDGAFHTAAEAFAERGYRTGAVLANQSLGRLSGFEQGFGTFVDGPPVLLYLEVLDKLPLTEALMNHHIVPVATAMRYLYRKTMMQTGRAQADVINQHVVDWLRRPSGEPFFLFVNYLDPHEPYDPPAAYRGRFGGDIDREVGHIRYDRKSGTIISSEDFTRDVVPRLSERQWEDLVALYDEEIAFLDDQIGALIAELRREGVYDRTILIVTADHGELFGEHGLATHFKSLSEEEIHVPLVLRYPPRIRAGTRVGTPVSLVDVLPTLFDLSGIAGGDEMDGRSLAPFMSADAGTRPTGTEQTISFLLRKPVRQYPHTAPGDLVALRTPTTKYVWSSTGQHQYFDLVADPKETRNLYGSSASVADLAAQVEAWRRTAGLDQPEGKLDRLTEDRLRSLGYIH